MARLTDRSGRPTSGQQQAAMVGIVTDNVDPEKQGRIMVEFPTLAGTPKSHWLRQISPMAGKERGLYSLPEIGDEVIVMFMQGSQDVGVVLGQVWNGVDVPPPEADGGYPTAGATEIPGAQLSTDSPTDGSGDYGANDRRYWRSRSGHLMMFDDTGGSESFQIWNNTNSMSIVFDTATDSIFLSNTGKDINIRCARDLIVEAGRDIKFYAGNNVEGESKMDTIHKAGMNIEVESGMDSKWVAGMNFNQEASLNWEAKGGVNATLEGSVATTLKGGATAELSGGGMTTVKGGVVMIN